MAWSVDRLGRSLQDLVAFLSELHAFKIDLYLHHQGIDTTTPAGKAMFQMMGVFAEFERAMIQERVRAGLRRAKDEGKQLGRPTSKPRSRPRCAGRIAQACVWSLPRMASTSIRCSASRTRDDGRPGLTAPPPVTGAAAARQDAVLRTPPSIFPLGQSGSA
jgi:Resolvase, N terminal domain